MAVWLVRGGGDGEFEAKYIADKRVYVTWERLDVDLRKLKDRAELAEEMAKRYSDAKPRAIQNWSSQVWPFRDEMQRGDLVVLPLKKQRAIQIGEITGDYHFEPEGPDPFFHWRPVQWVSHPIPRSHFGQDLLYSFGAFMTICRIQRNNAENRLRAMRSTGWKPETIRDVTRQAGGGPDSAEEEAAISDLEELARDRIALLINSRFKGHSLTRLVEAILKAQGYTTYRSAEGTDGGADILAGSGPLGFGDPKLCVEVKSEDKPIDRPTVDKLLGAVTKFGASEGLFVSWSGFKPNVQRELATSFFRVRLWSQTELLEQLFEHYEKFDEELKAELPLKRVWMVAVPVEE